MTPEFVAITSLARQLLQQTAELIDTTNRVRDAITPAAISAIARPKTGKYAELTQWSTTTFVYEWPPIGHTRCIAQAREALKNAADHNAAAANDIDRVAGLLGNVGKV
jgi:hypothetical protein